MNQNLENFQRIQNALASVQHELALLQHKHDKLERALSELQSAKAEYVLALSHATGIRQRHLHQYLK